MDYVLFSPEEAAELARVSSDEIISKVEAGELAGLRIAGSWRIPLKSVAELIAGSGLADSPGALEALFNDHDLWQRVLASHPEVGRTRTDTGLAVDGVQTYLKRAIRQVADSSKGQ